MKIRTYSELLKLPTWNERFKYLKLEAQIGNETFGQNRFLNQDFYRSPEWRRLRDYIILRDNGCDLGVEGMEIHGPIYIHHMNPITDSDIIHQSDYLIDPEYLISVSFQTHNGIHYGSIDLVEDTYVERKPNDICPWR